MKWIGCSLWMIAFAALLILSHSPVNAQPEKMILDLSAISGKTARPPVSFPHNRHVEAGLSCKDCHHLYKNGKNVLDESKLEEGNKGIRCSACHGPKSGPIWNRPSTINASAVTQNTRKKRRRQVPGTVGNVMSENNYLKN